MPLLMIIIGSFCQYSQQWVFFFFSMSLLYCSMEVDPFLPLWQFILIVLPFTIALRLIIRLNSITGMWSWASIVVSLFLYSHHIEQMMAKYQENPSHRCKSQVPKSPQEVKSYPAGNLSFYNYI